MSNPSGPDRDDTSNPPGPDRDVEATGSVELEADPGQVPTADPDEQVTKAHAITPVDMEPVTEVLTNRAPQDELDAGTPPPQWPIERRFTAPGFDARETAVIDFPPEPATEVFHTHPTPTTPMRKAAPQLIPSGLARKLPMPTQRSWGWVLALILIILALAAIAVLTTVLLSRGNRPKASQQDQVRATISKFDVAVQTGDLAALRGITCGTVRDGYVNYDEDKWADTFRRVSAAKRYPVVASIDQVVVNGDHAEANVTAFLAYAPQVRSTRSFDLQFRDNQWKICQAPNG